MPAFLLCFGPARRAATRDSIFVAIAVVVLDQITKAMVRDRLPLHDSISVIPGFLDLTRVHNTGAAFGMLNGVDFPLKTLVLSVVASVALAGVGWYALSVPLSDRFARIGVAGILGGAIGNLIDRATRVTCWTSSTPTGAAGTSGRSMSPTRRLPFVVFMILDILGLGRRSQNQSARAADNAV